MQLASSHTASSSVPNKISHVQPNKCNTMHEDGLLATSYNEDANDREEIDNQHSISCVRFLKIPRAAPCIENFGFHLTRTKWDPYPWVCEVVTGTPAALCGLSAGDCILEVNGIDVLGLSIADISKIVKSQSDCVELLVWNSGCSMDCDKISICSAPMTMSLKRLSVIVQSMLSLIECPVCVETITPPVMQCQNGHLLCLNCRIRAEKCPVCRDCYTPKRSLIAEQIYVTIANAFELFHAENKLRHKLFSGGSTFNQTPAHLAQQRFANFNGDAGQGRSARRGQFKPLLPTSKYLAKLLKTRTYSMENLTQSDAAATLLRTSSIDNFNSERWRPPPLPCKNELGEIGQSPSMKGKSMVLPSKARALNGISNHFSFSTNDLQQSFVKLETEQVLTPKPELQPQPQPPSQLEAAQLLQRLPVDKTSANVPASTSRSSSSNNVSCTKADSLLFEGKCRPGAYNSKWIVAKQKPFSAVPPTLPAYAAGSAYKPALRDT